MSGVKLGALNDWLDGSQECIQPLLTGKSSSSLKVSTSNASNARGVRDFSRGIATEKADLIKSRAAAPSSSSTSAQGATTSSSGRKTKAEVAVSDCLACSGCVTSAEAVVLETPGFDQFLEMLSVNNGNKNNNGDHHHVVVSVSPESLVNLHLRWNQHGTLVETLGKLESLFMFYASVPVTVTDCGIAHAVYLREVLAEIADSYEEVLPRTGMKISGPAEDNYLDDDAEQEVEVEQKGNNGRSAAAPGSAAAPSTSAQLLTIVEAFDARVEEESKSRQTIAKVAAQRGTGERKQRPVVASYCPGWTRYAEKVAPPGIAPYLSAVRNPLVIQGHLAKTLLKKCEFLKWYRSCFRFSMPSISNHFDFKEPPRSSFVNGKGRSSPKNVKHVMIAPCLDRKIETMRPEWRGTLDLVFPTNELERFLEPAALPTPLAAAVAAFSRAGAGESKIKARSRTTSKQKPHDNFSSSASKGQDEFEDHDRTRIALVQHLSRIPNGSKLPVAGDENGGASGAGHQLLEETMAKNSKLRQRQGSSSGFLRALWSTATTAFAALRGASPSTSWSWSSSSNEKIKVDVDDEVDPVLNAQRAVFAALEVRPVFDVAGFPLTAVRKHLGVDEALRLLAREDYRPLLRPTDPLLAQAGPWMRASGYRHIQNVITRLTAISAGANNRADRLNAGAGVEQEPGEGVERKRKVSTGREQVRRNKNDNSLGFVDVAACPGGCLNGGAQMRVAGGLPAMQAFWAEQPLFSDEPSENHHEHAFIADETYETGGQIHYYSFRRVDGGDQEIGGAGVVVAGDGEQKNDLSLARGKAAPTLNW